MLCGGALSRSSGGRKIDAMMAPTVRHRRPTPGRLSERSTLFREEVRRCVSLSRWLQLLASAVVASAKDVTVKVGHNSLQPRTV